MPSMARNLIFVKKPNFEGFGCSECNWVFTPDKEISGLSLELMKKHLEANRDIEFGAHACNQRGIRAGLRPV